MMTEEQRISKAHFSLMEHPSFAYYSGVFLVGRTKVVESGESDIHTAATDGYNTWYNRQFVAKLTDKQLRAVILHENLHKAFQQISVWRHLCKENSMLANMAMDYVINLVIEKADPEHTFVVLPEDALLDTKYEGMDTGAVFRALQKEQEANGKCSGEGSGFDQHDWDALPQDAKDKIEAQAKEIDAALRQGAIMAAKKSANMPRELGDLLNAKIDWRDVLREFVTSTCQEKDSSTWRRPARRTISSGVYMPSSIGESIGRIVVAIDMSGSIGANEVGQFLGELQNICECVKPEGIDLLYWDTEVCQHEKYDQDQLGNLISSTKINGGGGTAPSCVSEYIAAHKLKPECIIVLTDGYVGGDWGSGWSSPLLWAITSEEVAQTGKTVKLTV